MTFPEFCAEEAAKETLLVVLVLGVPLAIVLLARERSRNKAAESGSS
jgi:hypothetical protein